LAEREEITEPDELDVALERSIELGIETLISEGRYLSPEVAALATELAALLAVSHEVMMS